MPDPYRLPEPPPRERTRHGLEDRLVEVVLFVVGLLGVGIGVVHPSRVVELTMGAFLVVFALRGGSWPRRRAGSDD